MREVDGGVFVNEPNIGLIMETIRRILNEGVAKECGATLTGATVTRRSTGETVWPQAQDSA